MNSIFCEDLPVAAIIPVLLYGKKQTNNSNLELKRPKPVKSS